MNYTDAVNLANYNTPFALVGNTCMRNFQWFMGNQLTPGV